MKIVFLFLILVSCIHTRNKDSEFENVNIDLESMDATFISLGDISEEVEFIRLDSKNDALLSVIRQVEITDSFIFVHDSHALYRFNLQGLFVNQIGRKGKGPGEYVSIVSFSVDENGGFVYILDNTSKIMKFGFNGEFTGVNARIPRINNLFFFEDILFCSKAILNPQFLKDEDNYELILLSKDLIITKELIPVSRNQDINPMFVYFGKFYQFKDYLYYYNPLKDTVYVIDDTKLTPGYVFNKSPGVITEIDRMFETESILIVSITISNIWNYVIYDKYLKTTRLLIKPGALAGFQDDIHNLPVFIPRAQKGNTLIDFIYPYQLTPSDTLYNLVSQDDNPILRLVRVKKL